MSVFEVEPSPETDYFLDTLGGYDVVSINPTVDLDPNSAHKRVSRFFEGLSPEERRAYHRMAEKEFYVDDGDYHVPVLGFRPVEYALYVAVGLQIADPKRQYPRAITTMVQEVDDLATWFALISSDKDAPQLAITGYDDAARVYWEPATGLFGVRYAQERNNTLERLQEIRQYLVQPDRSSRYHWTITEKTLAHQKYMADCHNLDFEV